MSSMMPPGGPPPSIQIPGAGPAGPGPGAGSDAGPGDPDAGSVTSKLKKALALVQSAASQEGDDQDAASLSKIAADIHKAIAAEQALTDSAMGAGPGVKLVRKAAAGAGSQGGY